MRRVGVLGGMGPEATVLLLQRVVDAVPARDDADHVPLLVDQNPQVPSRIAHLIDGTGEDPAPVLADMARRLLAAGAEALAMPCNTAHHFAASVRSAADIPFLDMIALSAQQAKDCVPLSGRVGILASPAVRQTRLFEAPLAEHGLVAVYPPEDDALLTAIRAIKAEGPSPHAAATVRTASAALLEIGAEVQVAACTEFSLLADPAAPGARLIDTLDVLVQAIVAFSMKAKEERAQGPEQTASAEG